MSLEELPVCVMSVKPELQIPAVFAATRARVPSPSLGVELSVCGTVGSLSLV